MLPCPFISQAPPACSMCLAPTTIAIFFYPLSALDDWLLTSSSYPTPKTLVSSPRHTQEKRHQTIWSSCLPAPTDPLKSSGFGSSVLCLWSCPFQQRPILSSLYGSSSTWKDKDSRRETWLWILPPCFFCLKNNRVFIYSLRISYNALCSYSSPPQLLPVHSVSISWLFLDVRPALECGWYTRYLRYCSVAVMRDHNQGNFNWGLA